jgi:tetratricopeptide (TPR) repeat protein
LQKNGERNKWCKYAREDEVVAEVFISYAREDRPMAEAIASDLKTVGISVWWDTELYTGEDFHDAILLALDTAKAVIVIWSDAAVASRWVKGEADHAAEAEKLIPLAAPGFDKRRVPLNLRGFHIDELSDRSKLLRALERFDVVPRYQTSSGQESSARVEELLASAAEHHDTGSYRYAVDDYHKAIELDPECVQAYCGLASVLVEQGKDDEAIRFYTNAIEIDGMVAEVYFRRGLAFVEIGHHKLAVNDFERALQLDPAHQGAREALDTEWDRRN